MPACWMLGRERTLLAILHVLSKFVRVGECSKTISQLLCIDKKHPPCVSHSCHSQREIPTNGHERIKCLQLFPLSLSELFQGSPYSHSGTLRAPSKRESSHVRSLPCGAPGTEDTRSPQWRERRSSCQRVLAKNRRGYRLPWQKCSAWGLELCF